MKKSILAFALICAVAVTQAATISWKSGSLKTPTADTGVFSGTSVAKNATAYVFVIQNNGAAAYDGEWASKSGEQLWAAYQDGSLAKAAVATSPATDSNAGGQANWTSTLTSENGTYAYAVAIYTYNDGKDDWYIASGSSAQVAINGTVGGGTSIGSGVGKWTKVEPVPEPCTVALLALGLAAVGLKRKVC